MAKNCRAPKKNTEENKGKDTANATEDGVWWRNWNLRFLGEFPNEDLDTRKFPDEEVGYQKNFWRVFWVVPDDVCFLGNAADAAGLWGSIELGNPTTSFLRGARMFSYILVIAY